jgi:hypothetical protein
MIDTCHDWNRLPSEFDLCLPEDDLAVMMAYSSTVSRMRSWEAQEQERKSEEATSKRGKKGR